MDAQKIATQTLKDYPGQNEVHITSDGQAFFNGQDAINHANRNKFDAPQVFFREGFEPEDTKGIEEALQLAQEDLKTANTFLSQIEAAADLEQNCPVVDQKTNSVVASVISLREGYEKNSNYIVEVETDVMQAANLEIEAPQVTDETPQAVKAVLELRVAYQTVQNELDTLKASTLEVKKEETKQEAKGPSTGAGK